jgi:hypothetical protein
LTQSQVRAAETSRDPRSLLAIGLDVSNLKKIGFSALQLKRAGCDPQQLVHGGFSALEVIKGCDFSVKDLLVLDVPALKSAGLDALQLKDAGCSLKKLLEGKFLIADLKLAGFSPRDFMEAGVWVGDLIEAKYDTHFILTAGYDAAVLRAHGFTATDVKNAGYSAQQMANSSTKDKYGDEKVGFSVDELRAAGFDDNSLIVVDFASENQLKGFSSLQLMSNKHNARFARKLGFHLWELVDTDVGIGWFLSNGWSLHDLRPLSHIDRFSVSEIRAAGISIISLIEANYTLEDLLAGGFDESQLRDAGVYNWCYQLRDCCIKMPLYLGCDTSLMPDIRHSQRRDEEATVIDDCTQWTLSFMTKFRCLCSWYFDCTSFWQCQFVGFLCEYDRSIIYLPFLWNCRDLFGLCFRSNRLSANPVPACVCNKKFEDGDEDSDEDSDEDGDGLHAVTPCACSAIYLLKKCIPLCENMLEKLEILFTFFVDSVIGLLFLQIPENFCPEAWSRLSISYDEFFFLGEDPNPVGYCWDSISCKCHSYFESNDILKWLIEFCLLPVTWSFHLLQRIPKLLCALPFQWPCALCFLMSQLVLLCKCCGNAVMNIFYMPLVCMALSFRWIWKRLCCARSCFGIRSSPFCGSNCHRKPKPLQKCFVCGLDGKKHRGADFHTCFDGRRGSFKLHEDDGSTAADHDDHLFLNENDGDIMELSLLSKSDANSNSSM